MSNVAARNDALTTVNSPIRAEIDKLTGSIIQTSAERSKFPFASQDRVLVLPQIELMIHAAWFWGKDIYCFDWVMYKYMNEPWAECHEVDNTSKYSYLDFDPIHFWYTPKELRQDPIKFLSEREYTEVEEPQTGDIVIYGEMRAEQSSPEGKFKCLHMGVVMENGQVISKWGRTGHVLRHDTWAVPWSYGNVVRYMRRNNYEGVYPSTHRLRVED